MRIEDERVLVAVGEPPQGVQRVPTVILGMPQGAWEFMADGLTHTFDLTKVGIPIQLMIFRGKDHVDVKSKLLEADGYLKDGAVDQQGNFRDLGIEEPSKQ